MNTVFSHYIVLRTRIGEVIQLHAFLEKEEVPHVYLEGPGVHDMVFWSEYIVKAIEWMFG